MVFGFLNIKKPKGITSHDVVAKIRKVAKIKQVGHTGTLDPFAEGVLPICVGKATRLIEYLPDDKEYIATVQFGKNTDTYDIDGVVIAEFDKKVNREEILSALKAFQGEITQLPPVYSAIKVNGKKLYDYARAGQDVEIQPRKVFIHNAELLDFDEENQTARLKVACSKGTYIRSIAYDLGKILNCGAYLSELLRTKAGKFCIEKALNLEDLKEVSDVERSLTNPLCVIDLPKLEITDKEHEKVIQGQAFVNNSVQSNSFLILIYNNSIDAVAFVEDNTVKVKKVFV